jgi:Ca2+-transporting ATPase
MITRDEMDQLSEEQYSDEVSRLSVYCGISAGQKLRLINHLQQKGEVVAMTGYAAYDVDPMRGSDLAIAAANICSDITIHYSDLILLKSGFQTIVEAIEVSRATYNNFRRSIRYFLSINLAMGGMLLFLFLVHLIHPDFPAAFNLVQILWVNILIVGVLAFLLSSESNSTELTQSRPQRMEDTLFTRNFKMSIIIRAVSVALTPIVIFIISLNLGGWLDSLPPAHTHNQAAPLKASTSAFTSLILAQIILFFQSYRRQHQSFLDALLASRPLFIWACVVVAIQILLIYFAPLNALFGTLPLTIEWLLIIPILGILYTVLHL